MIFHDETGRRWHHIKRSTIVLSSAIVVPVVGLMVGTYVFNPTWGNLAIKSVPTRIAGTLRNTIAGATISSTPAISPTKHTVKKSAAVTSSPQKPLSLSQNIPSSSSQPSPTPSASSSTSTPQTQTTTPTYSKNTIKSTYGLGHHFN
ncbi:MAG: hypothetical protein NVSMB46_09470 [Candidatus Saccharimonadales bacterium]